MCLRKILPLQRSREKTTSRLQPAPARDICSRLPVSASSPARWYGSQIPVLLLLLASALAAALAAQAAEAAAAGWLAAGPCLIERKLWKS